MPIIIPFWAWETSLSKGVTHYYAVAKAIPFNEKVNIEDETNKKESW